MPRQKGLPSGIPTTAFSGDSWNICSRPVLLAHGILRDSGDATVRFKARLCQSGSFPESCMPLHGGRRGGAALSTHVDAKRWLLASCKEAHGRFSSSTPPSGNWPEHTLRAACMIGRVYEASLTTNTKSAEVSQRFCQEVEGCLLERKLSCAVFARRILAHCSSLRASWMPSAHSVHVTRSS